MKHGRSQKDYKKRSAEKRGYIRLEHSALSLLSSLSKRASCIGPGMSTECLQKEDPKSLWSGSHQEICHMWHPSALIPKSHPSILQKIWKIFSNELNRGKCRIYTHVSWPVVCLYRALQAEFHSKVSDFRRLLVWGKYLFSKPHYVLLAKVVQNISEFKSKPMGMTLVCLPLN